MMRKLVGISLGLGVVAAVAVGGITAAPAGAAPVSPVHRANAITGSPGTKTPMNADECENYLRGKHYNVGAKVMQACTVGQSWVGYGVCFQELLSVDVKPPDAGDACDIAQL